MLQRPSENYSVRARCAEPTGAFPFRSGATFRSAAMGRTRRSSDDALRLFSHDIVAFAQDTRIYMNRERPSSNGRPLAQPPTTTFRSAAPRELPTKQIVESELQRSLIDDGNPLAAGSMAAVIEAALACTPAGDAIAARDIPVSPASHDNTQLEWGRPYVPECCMGSSCVAALLEGSLGPLPIYLSLSEQRDLGPESVFETPRLCVLCIRQQCALLKTSSALAGCREIATYCPPPFKNLFNCHEGYRNEHCGALIPTSDGDARITGISDAMSVRHRTKGDGTTVWFIDQSAMIYGVEPT